MEDDETIHDQHEAVEKAAFLDVVATGLMFRSRRTLWP
jgi:hypothetical protein